ncbi:monooxygenase [Streptomyces sp. A7024]|uniref:Monooxygenase n=1 Tax=Streptomyces coryli TaxID=1128680 RepID=A0A6G4U885_9ACTN|nr:monooxygenase [Streptomyces coryli]
MDPVIVVGAGPVGLALSLVLGSYGVNTVLLDGGGGEDEARQARTVVLRPDTAAFLERLGCGPVLREEGLRLAGWRAVRGAREAARADFADEAEAPLHIPQFALTRALRAALDERKCVEYVRDVRADALEAEPDGVILHTRPAQGGDGTWWRGSHLIGCDGARSTVRKLLGVRFAGRTAVERHAVAAIKAELRGRGEALLQRGGQRRGLGAEVSARPLPGGVWRLDWLLGDEDGLVTPEALLERIAATLAAWGVGDQPYQLLDTGVHTVHHRLARHFRRDRCFLAGDAAHLGGAIGTQQLEEGLRDARNLGWKLALSVQQPRTSEVLLESYETERRGAVARRLRAADQALPILRKGNLRGRGTAGLRLLRDGHLGEGELGGPDVYADSPLAPEPLPAHAVAVGTEWGAQVADVPVMPAEGGTAMLRERLGGVPLVVFLAPGTRYWDRSRLLGAGLMPKLAQAVAELPLPTDLLIAEEYPGATPHTVLVVRPDGVLTAALGGVQAEELYTCVDALRGGIRV